MALYLEAAVVGGFADYTNTEASITAVFIVGSIFALLSGVLFYVGLLRRVPLLGSI